MPELFNETETQIDPEKDYLPELVGDGKKFKTAQDLARSALHKDSHIIKLERENRELREQTAKSLSMEDFMSKLTESQRKLLAPQDTQTSTTEIDPPAREQSQKPLTQSELEALLENTLNSREAKRQRDQNVQAVQKTLVESMGPDYVTQIKAKARELSLNEAFLSDLAETQPQAFLKLMDVSKARVDNQSQTSIFSPPQGSVNTTRLSAVKNMNGHKTFKEWQDLRRKDSKEYLRTNAKMHQDAMALGEEFYSN